MARRNQHSKEELQQLAVAAVRELVTEQGVDKLSARKLAERIGYTPGMLYHVFANQDEMILHANAVTLDTLLAAMAAHQSLPAAQALRAMAAEYMQLAMAETALWQLVVSHRMGDQQAVPRWYQRRTDALFALVEQQVARLAQGHSAGQIQLAAQTLWSAVHGITVLSVDNKLDVAGQADANEMLDSLLRHYLGSWQREAP